ncbi:hypothetical protein J2S43_004079 [Catenuloplanes nepalensis]|uniref:Uncharacterized protein n=1 Tax=Catenuloplanes nepalensis TaxID=587533 RepID=A0ABT9MVU4_9ACTN|nr:hypothetical protein [Catenuloplanes nepalensis]MDP9795567.1 hypothetical protein [Catenuloplanes nepalensis]
MTWRIRPSAGSRSGLVRASRLLLAAAAMLAAFVFAPAAAVAAPAPGGASVSSADGALRIATSTSAATATDGGGFSVMSGSCPNAGQYIDPWSLLFVGCTLTGVPTTAVSARCTNGTTLGPVHAPPGIYDIYVDCYPSFFSQLTFL